MKPFFQIVIKFIIVASLSGFACYYLYSLNSNSVDKNKNEKYDFINFGNSHGNGLYYNAFGLEAKNMYFNGNSPYYFYQLYKFYKKNLNEGAIVFIPLSYFSFGVEAGLDDETFNDQFYGYLNPSQIRNYKLQKHFDLLNNIISTNVFSLMEKKELENPKQEKAPRFLPYEYAKFSYSFPKIKKDNSMEGKDIAKVQQNAFNEDYVDNNIKYLSSLIDDAKASGFKVVLLTPPYLEVYYKNYSSEWLDNNFYKNIKLLQNKYKIPYLDYSKVEIFRDNPGLFNDTHHINNYGRIRFTKMVLQELINLNLIDHTILPKEIKSLANKPIETDLILERAEILNSKTSKENILFLFFNQSLKKHFENRKVRIKFTNGDKPVFLELRDSDDFLIFKFDKLHKNALFLFEEKGVKITEDYRVN